MVPSVRAVPLSSILGTGKGEGTYSTLLNSDFPLNLALDLIPSWVLDLHSTVANIFIRNFLH